MLLIAKFCAMKLAVLSDVGMSCKGFMMFWWPSKSNVLFSWLNLWIQTPWQMIHSVWTESVHRLLSAIASMLTRVTLCPGTFAAVFGRGLWLFWRHLHPGIPKWLWLARLTLTNQDSTWWRVQAESKIGGAAEFTEQSGMEWPSFPWV